MSDDKRPERVEFKLDEEAIVDLIELIEHGYQPSEKLEKFAKNLRKARDYFINQRLEETFGTDAVEGISDADLHRMIEEEASDG